jgi:hypothetical protein
MTVNLALSLWPYFAFCCVAHCCAVFIFYSHACLFPLSSWMKNWAVPGPLIGILPPRPERQMPFTGFQDVKKVSSLKIEANTQGSTVIGIESESKPWTASSSLEVIPKVKVLNNAHDCCKLLKIAGLHSSCIFT